MEAVEETPVEEMCWSLAFDRVARTSLDLDPIAAGALIEATYNKVIGLPVADVVRLYKQLVESFGGTSEAWGSLRMQALRAQMMAEAAQAEKHQRHNIRELEEFVAASEQEVTTEKNSKSYRLGRWLKRRFV